MCDCRFNRSKNCTNTRRVDTAYVEVDYETIYGQKRVMRSRRICSEQAMYRVGYYRALGHKAEIVY